METQFDLVDWLLHSEWLEAKEETNKIIGVK